MRKYELRLSGFGGQGIILAGIVLGEAASIYDGKEAVQSQSYGPEARGGATKAEVIISDEPIDYPKIKKADLLLCMSQESYNKYSNSLKEGGILITDTHYVKDLKPGQGRVYQLPLTDLAIQKAGKKIVSNIVALGAVAAISGAVTYDALKEAVMHKAPPGTEQLNMRAVEEGYKAGKEILEQKNKTIEEK